MQPLIHWSPLTTSTSLRPPCTTSLTTSLTTILATFDHHHNHHHLESLWPRAVYQLPLIWRLQLLVCRSPLRQLSTATSEGKKQLSITFIKKNYSYTLKYVIAPKNSLISFLNERGPNIHRRWTKLIVLKKIHCLDKWIFERFSIFPFFNLWMYVNSSCMRTKTQFK